MTRSLYQSSIAEFLDDVVGARLPTLLADQLMAQTGAPPSDAERQSWANSLTALAAVLSSTALASSAVFVELFMPLNNRRCDVLLTGRNAGGDTAVVIELKQWSFLQPSHLPEHVLVPGHHAVHPSIQADDYVHSLRHFHSAFGDSTPGIEISGVAYCHNLPRRFGAHLRDPAVFGAAVVDCPIFLAGEERLLARVLAERLVPGPGDAPASRIAAGRPRPSPKLLDLVARTIRGEHQWRLLDVQKTVYFAIRSAVELARGQGQRTAIVVRGGPGTGKSVIALQLLAHGAAEGLRVAHATGSKAFKTVLQGQTVTFARDLMKRIHGVRFKKDLPLADLFTTFAVVARLGVDAPDTLDLTVCDEAHRLWYHRQRRYPGGHTVAISETPLIEELLAASRVTAFFLDDDQSVRSGEIGRADYIVEHAARLGVRVEQFELDAQYRCAGSRSYIDWVDGVLELRDDLDLDWRRDDAYRVRIWGSMPEMVAHLEARRAGHAACRLLAGYCWRWSNPTPGQALPRDLRDDRFDGWTGAWIERREQNMKPTEDRYFRWATRDEAFYEVGSIYSAQGFEFDDIGLIWGEDLVWRTDRWVAQLEANQDPVFKRDLARSGADPTDKLRNIYRVLLTRGMRSTHLFILDAETRARIADCLALPAAQPRAAAVGARLPHTPPTIVDTWQPGALPVVDLRAAAGRPIEALAGLTEPNAAQRWLAHLPHAPPTGFVAQVRGESMIPLIADGAWCVFRPTTIDATGRRPVLVRISDDDDTARFAVKHLQIEWIQGSDGRLERDAIVLESLHPDHPSLRLDRDSSAAVIAELVQVIGALPEG